MSLINDALKRAQQDKASKPAVSPPFLHPATDDACAGGDVPVGVWTVGPRVSRETGARGRMFAVSAAALVVLVCGLAWTWSRSDRPAHVAASVAPQTQPEPEPLAPSVLAGDTKLVSQAVSSQLNEAGGAAATESAAPSSKIAGDGSDNTPLFVLAPAASTSQPETSPAPVSPRTEAAKFTLSGILRIGGQSMATINGKLVGVGDTVDGGRVLAIESQSVELESAGQRFSLRM